MTKVSNAFAHPFYCTPFFSVSSSLILACFFLVVVRRTSKWIVRWRRLAHPITITINIRSSEVICLGLSLTRQTIHLLELQIITPPRIYCSRSLMPIHTSLPPQSWDAKVSQNNNSFARMARDVIEHNATFYTHTRMYENKRERSGRAVAVHFIILHWMASDNGRTLTPYGQTKIAGAFLKIDFGQTKRRYSCHSYVPYM